MDSSAGCTWNECRYVRSDDDYDTTIQNNLDAPMPWIGMYIAAASAICTLAMAADALKGFKEKRPWFPCKYFSLNAASLTVLTVSTKLSVDLTTSMMGVNDKLARVGSLLMISTALCNLMTSLASLDNNEILLNLAALGILVLTIAGNVTIHNVETRDIIFNGHAVMAKQIACIAALLLLLIVLCSTAIAVPTTKRHIESKYLEMDKIVWNDPSMKGQSFTIDELRVVLKKYWVMAETGNPQFVMARSVLSVISGMMCLMMAMVMVEAHIKVRLIYHNFVSNSSNYKWSINWILLIQSGGVAVGTIAPLSRWFVAVRFQCSRMGCRSFRDELKIERYWVQKLVEWRESSLSSPIRNRKFRKVVHEAKRLLLNVCLGIQITVVLSGKLFLIFWSAYAIVGFWFFHHIKKFKALILKQSNDMHASESRDGDAEMDFSRFVLLLEGEPELPSKTLTIICSEVDRLIEIGKRKQPKNVLKLLHKSVNFNGVIEFDSKKVRSLHISEEPPKCWSLAVVTLTSIAVALPNITYHKMNQLLKGVSEGLSLVRLIEKAMDANGDLTSIRKASDVVWVGLELYNKWQDEDIQGTDMKDRTHKNTVQELSDIAEKTVEDFKSRTTDYAMKNPLNWPVRVTAANSMYRTCQTILLSEKTRVGQNEEEMFERLSIMISGILAACFTNLARVIAIKCRGKATKERTESVCGAAVLLGESEQVLEIVQQRVVPNSLDPDKAGYIEEWRVAI